MQNITRKQKEHLYEGGHVGVTITGETLDGDLVTITEDDIIEGTLTIERNWSHGSTIEIGCADTSELIFELDNSDGRWSDIRWEGTRLTVVLDIDGEPLQAGIFTVDEPPRKLTTMQIRALDDMARFNRPYVPGIAYPATLRQILIDCCQQCGVALHTTEFVNDDYVVSQQPEGDDITFHHVVAWVAELAGCNAWIDHLARLRLSWYGDQQPEPAQLEFTRPSLAIHPETGEEVPEDTPVFVDFAGGRKGSLMVEGTENIIDFENAPMRQYYAVSQKGNIDNFTAWEIEATRETTSSQYVFWRFDAVSGQKYTASIIVYDPQDCFGRIRLLDSGNFDTALLKDNMEYLGNDLYRGIITVESGATQETSYGFLSYFAAGKPTGSKYWVYAGQVENKEYDTPYQIGTRAAPLKRITLPEPLPDEFGVGVRFKPLHTIPSDQHRTIFQVKSGNDDIRVDILPNYKRLRLLKWISSSGQSNFISIGSQDADTIIGVYLQYFSDHTAKLYARVAGGEIMDITLGDTRELTGLNDIIIGVTDAGTRNSNAVFADFVLHDRPEDIDPEGYLAGVPDDADGGGES